MNDTFRGKHDAQLILVLLIITGVLSVSYRLFGNRVLKISPTSAPDSFKGVNAISDEDQGGTSTTQLISTKKSWRIAYHLEPTIPYPFAILHLEFDNHGDGVDFSQFEEIYVYARAKGEGADRIRLNLRNAHPDYAALDDADSLKYNEVHFPPRGQHKPRVLTWGHFQVAGWWIAQKSIPFKHRHIDVTNVRWIEFITPELVNEGDGEIEVYSIEFHGKWIAEKTYLRILLLLWMSVLGTYAGFQVLHLRTLVATKVKREGELLELNHALSLETEKLKKHAERDPLTGLLNRYGLRRNLLTLLNSPQSNRNEIAAIFADIDHFKKVNDTLGHAEGDRIIKYVATLFAENSRKSDILVRWGGEEFLLICADTDATAAEGFATKLRLRLKDSRDRITCSFGIAILGEGSITDLIGRADGALYQAKHDGRDCVRVSSEKPARHSRPSFS